MNLSAFSEYYPDIKENVNPQQLQSDLTEIHIKNQYVIKNSH